MGSGGRGLGRSEERDGYTLCIIKLKHNYYVLADRTDEVSQVVVQTQNLSDQNTYVKNYHCLS